MTTSALECDRLEEGFVRIAEVVIQVVRNDVAPLELADLVWAGADGLPVGVAARGPRSDAALELVLLEDRAVRADPPPVDEWLGRPVRNHDRVRVARDDALDALAAIEGRCRRQRVALVQIGEGHVVR